MLILRGGWDGARRVHWPVVSLEIIDGKVWLQADNTDLRIAERLEEASIPKGNIVLASKRRASVHKILLWEHQAKTAPAANGQNDNHSLLI